MKDHLPLKTIQTMYSRLNIYKTKAQELVDNDAAYPCFCSLSRMELMRKEAIKNRQIFRYDKRCRNIDKREAKERMESGESHAIRFKLVPGMITVHDAVVGESSVDTSLSEGDFVILKSDSFPTYHLANVVDDHLMNISHVLRGTEWFKSTPKHLMMYQAFGWTPPAFAHLPLLLNEDGTKLSKRNDDFRVDKLRAKNYFPETVANFLLLTGGGWRPETIQIASMDELAEIFAIESLAKQSTRLSLFKLNVLNRFYMHYQIKNNRQAFVQTLRQYLIDRFGEEKLKDQTDEYLLFLFCEVPERFNSFGDFADEIGFVWDEPELSWNCKRFASLKNLDDLCEGCCDLVSKEWDASGSRLLRVGFIKNFCESKDVDFRNFFSLVRLCLSNKTHGIPIGQMLFALGKEEFIRRVQRGFQYTRDKLEEYEKNKTSS
ncbi:putative glutamate--tRNA ligase, mitochondrial isoform X2 [Brevipalpus obovatus]|uniref:putative glutamate--tRNA ligase, mitochondrial isoform X2 n=1 Tax=Brevipalpus obovatus TaxID=246614 RepID=UPI003D9FA937